MLSHPEKEAILASGGIEMKQLEDMGVFEFPSAEELEEIRRDGQKILRCKMVYARKFGSITAPNGSIRDVFKKWKGRLAVIGTAESKLLDCCWSTFSPTIGMTAMRTLVSLMCRRGFDVRSYDLSGAFLGTDLGRAVYVRLPEEAGEHAGKIVRCVKAIYGLKTSSRDFVKSLQERILSFEHDGCKFEKMYMDHCIYVYRGRHAPGLKWDKIGTQRPASGFEISNHGLVRALRLKQEFSQKELDNYSLSKLSYDSYIKVDDCYYKPKEREEIVLSHFVDDIICGSNSYELRERFLDHLRQQWKITDEGVLKRFVGLNFVRNETGDRWEVSMGPYIDKVCKRFNLEDARRKETPMDAGFMITPEDIREDPTPEMEAEFRSLIGSIAFASITVRWDVAYSVSVLSRYLMRPNKKVIAEAKRVIRYLKSTRDFKIRWTTEPEFVPAELKNVLWSAVDASYAADVITRRSHGGYLVYLNGGCVSWKSGLQKMVTLSSCESEFVALCSVILELRYLRQLLDELGYTQRRPSLIWEDNKAAIIVAEGETSSAGRAKHIDVRFKHVAQSIREGVARVRYISTKWNYADIMTKPLGRLEFKRLRGLCEKPEEGTSVSDALYDDVGVVEELANLIFFECW